MTDNNSWWVGMSKNDERLKGISSLGQHFCLFQHCQNLLINLSASERLKETPPLKVSPKEKETQGKRHCWLTGK